MEICSLILLIYIFFSDKTSNDCTICSSCNGDVMFGYKMNFYQQMQKKRRNGLELEKCILKLKSLFGETLVTNDIGKHHLQMRLTTLPK